MALTQGESAAWADISNLYTTLRSIQTTHGLTNTATPGSSSGTNILPTDITPINTALEAMKSEKHLRNSSYVGQGTNPTRGELISSALITNLRTKLDNLRNVCHFDSFNAGFNSSFLTSFNSSFLTSFNSSFLTSFNSSFLTSFRSSFNSSFGTSDSFGDTAGFSFFAGECTSFGN